MTVLLAGCGDLGTEVGLRFSEAGHRVVGLRRDTDALPEAIRGDSLDLTTEVPVPPEDTEIVVIATTADGHSEDDYRAIYLDGMHHVLDGLEREAVTPRRVLMVSSTAVYGISDGRWIDEDTPAEPNAMNGGVLREAENALHRRVPWATVLRLSGIYGPGRTSLIEQVRAGGATVPEQSRHTNRIHRDDAAAAIVHLTTRGPEPAATYLGSDDEPAERGDVLRFLADELGVSHPPVSGPAPARGGDKRCDNTRLRETGFDFTHPSYREGYRAVLAGWGSRHP